MTLAAVSPGARPRRFLSSRTMISSNAPRRDRAVLALVLVAPVARDADDADRPARARVRRWPPAPSRPDLRRRLDHHPVHEVGQLAHPVDVVAVVDDDADPADVEQVEPARAPGRTTS